MLYIFCMDLASTISFFWGNFIVTRTQLKVNKPLLSYIKFILNIINIIWIKIGPLSNASDI